MVSETKSIHCIPQTATLTPFTTPIPAISHLLKFGLNPEKFPLKFMILMIFLSLVNLYVVQKRESKT